MRKILIFFIVICFSLVSLSAADKNAINGAGTIIWTGIDFSQVKMIGPDFNNPEAIFPGMLKKWNDLFMKERLSALAADLGKNIALDVDGTRLVNENAAASQIIYSPGPDDGIGKTHITDDIIAKQVSSYKMNSKSGIALVYIADRFAKLDKQGAVYVVYFDVASRNVLFSKREVHDAAGFGFRNYWFRVIKRTSAAI